MKVGDRIKIQCSGLRVVGRVHSVNGQHIWEGIERDEKIVSSQPSAIEMYDETTNMPHYWKAADGNGQGVVHLWGEDETWLQVFPRYPVRGWTLEEKGIARKTFEKYVGRPFERGERNGFHDATFDSIVNLVAHWSAGSGLLNEVGYADSLEIARTVEDPMDRPYVNEVRTAYNDVVGKEYK